jgi:hypothetical protein
MKSLQIDLVNEHVNKNIVDFHTRRIRSLQELQLERLLTKNPYLLRAKNVSTASDLITSLLEAFLSSSEEKLFGDFLEGLAVFVAQNTCGGYKSSAPGVDLEFENGGLHYLVSVKSGTNWGNSSQQRRLEQDLQDATRRLKQSHHGANVQPTLGICYGKTRTSYLRGYLKVVGQNFWYLISENKELYKEIIEPVGYRAREHNESFLEERNQLANRLTKSFLDRFCDGRGRIDWPKLVEFNSGNFDLYRYLS